MNDWKIFLWAAMHHPDFRYCQILFPCVVDFWRFGETFRITITFQLPKLDIPWDVERDYQRRNQQPVPQRVWTGDYDDIPF